jgi:AraC family transcriptional regulator
MFLFEVFDKKRGTEPMSNRYPEIDEVIAYIHNNIYDPLPLARLAEYAAYSPYHFSRIFKERMGLSPQYFIAALRLQKAKDLLLNTNLSIRDVGLEIGQQSLGTFTTRFTERVGVTPSQFRNSAQHTGSLLQSLQRLEDWRDVKPLHPYNCVEGIIEADQAFEGVILIGLFARPLPEGLPLYGTLLPGLGKFRIAGIKPGVYYLMATSVSWGTQSKDLLLPQATLRTRAHAPIVVKPHTSVPYQEVMLYPPKADDPPILISLPVLMNQFMNRNNQASQM